MHVYIYVYMVCFFFSLGSRKAGEKKEKIGNTFLVLPTYHAIVAE